MVVEGILIGILGNAAYETIKNLLRKSGIIEGDKFYQSIYKAIDNTVQSFFDLYGNEFGAPAYSFLARQENIDIIIELFFYGKNLLDIKSLNLSGYDNSKTVSNEALNYFFDKLHENIKNDWHLDKVISEKYFMKWVVSNQEKILNNLKDINLSQIDINSYKTKVIFDIENNSKPNILQLDVDFDEVLCKYSDLRDENDESIIQNSSDSLMKGNNKSILILGEYGSGKTTLSLKLTHYLLKETAIIPFFIEMKKLRENILDNVLKQIGLYLKIKGFGLYDFQGLSNSQNILLILDGFDESFWAEKNENVISNVINEILLLKEYCSIILTSRPNFFLSAKEIVSYFKNTFKQVHINPLNQNQILFLLKMHNRIDLAKVFEKNEDLYKLASRPLLLKFLMETNIESIKYLPYSEVMVYQNYIEELIIRDRLRRKILTKKIIIETLQDIALYCLQNNQNDISIIEIEKIIAKISELNKVELNTAISELISSSFLIHSWREGFFRFSHKSLLDFFIANSITAQIRNKDLSEEVVDDLYYMLQSLLFIRGLLNEDDINVLMVTIQNISGKRRPLLIMISRQLIEKSKEFKGMLKDLLYNYPYIEAASKIEIIYAIYRFSLDEEKLKQADILKNNIQDYIATSKTQFGASSDFLKWARNRISEVKYYKYREFLYFLPLMLAGDKSDIDFIAPFLKDESQLVREQAKYAVEYIKNRSEKITW